MTGNLAVRITVQLRLRYGRNLETFYRNSITVQLCYGIVSFPLILKSLYYGMRNYLSYLIVCPIAQTDSIYFFYINPFTISLEYQNKNYLISYKFNMSKTRKQTNLSYSRKIHRTNLSITQLSLSITQLAYLQVSNRIHRPF